ncbi:glutamic acid-rich protein-like isoform X3 [Lineus longissimus]|uniref:glutamic acid-rich protein-like isoform X3 n=1 Tax=Lineus longissimus TaxID=88925 RepID=UPI00315C835E
MARCEPRYVDWKSEVQEFAKAVKSGRSDRRSDSSALDSIRIEIEVYSSNIKQQKYDISKCADSSKKRGHLRQKMEKEKKKLAAVIELYTSKSGEEIVIEDVTKEDYIFPWEQCSGYAVMSYSLKKKLVDIHEHIHRYQEEKLLLVREMKAATSYLTGRVISLKEMLKVADRSPDEFANYLDRDEAYHLTSANDRVIRGAMVEIRGTLEFYIDLLEQSANVFHTVTRDEEYLETFDILYQEDEEEERAYECESNDDDDDDDDDFVDDDDDDDDDGNNE